jgi:hypothetical protein
MLSGTGSHRDLLSVATQLTFDGDVVLGYAVWLGHAGQGSAVRLLLPLPIWGAGGSGLHGFSIRCVTRFTRNLDSSTQDTPALVAGLRLHRLASSS